MTTSILPLPSQGFRLEHADLRQRLVHLETMVGALARATRDKQVALMREVVSFLEGHVNAHAQWEERVLYPVVDRQAGSGTEPFTASMRHEHRIIGRWVKELSREAARPVPDARAFARRADNLLGLMTAHFEEEEEVLLPVLDRTMTAEQFQREVISPAEN
jgi:hemerythrin-like domain-containing protein